MQCKDAIVANIRQKESDVSSSNINYRRHVLGECLISNKNITEISSEELIKSGPIYFIPSNWFKFEKAIETI